MCMRSPLVSHLVLHLLSSTLKSPLAIDNVEELQNIVQHTPICKQLHVTTPQSGGSEGDGGEGRIGQGPWPLNLV
jgi:hypothetical protein